MTPIFFPTQTDFRQWLSENHATETEIIVGYYNVKSGKKCLTWSESVDQALCFGWIDGVRRSIDDESYCNRFTPRKPKSNWSAVNIAKVAELTKLGLMKPAGIAAFAKREESRSKIYAYENEPVKLSVEFETKFKAHEKAWTFFEKLPNGYKKIVTNWVMSAKQEATRQSRLQRLIDESGNGRRL